MFVKKFQVNADHARVPAALPVFLRRPIQPIRYGLWTKFRDWFDGRRDRGPKSAKAGTDATPQVIVSPWLQRLEAECLNTVAQERSLTESLVTVIGRQIAELQGRGEAAQNTVAKLEDSLATEGSANVTDEAANAAEQYSSPEERLQRRRREQSRRLSTLGSARDAASEVMRVSAEQIAVLDQEKLSHWTVLQQRARVLFEHYQRRAATYTRSMERRRVGELLRVPVFELPDWVFADVGAGRPSARGPMNQPIH